MAMKLKFWMICRIFLISSSTLQAQTSQIIWLVSASAAGMMMMMMKAEELIEYPSDPEALTRKRNSARKSNWVIMAFIQIHLSWAWKYKKKNMNINERLMNINKCLLNQSID